jgi:hypothetical protein
MLIRIQFHFLGALYLRLKRILANPQLLRTSEKHGLVIRRLKLMLQIRNPEAALFKNFPGDAM